MRLTRVLALVLVLIALAVAPAAADAEKPAANLSGAMDIEFTVPPLDCDGDSVFWQGTVVLNDVTYGMIFASGGDPVIRHNTNHYVEHFVIFEGSGPCPGTVVLEGDLRGVGRFSNGKLVENGTVTNANEDFVVWEGRRMHADGLVTEIAPGLPEGFTGTIRFN